MPTARSRSNTFSIDLDGQLRQRMLRDLERAQREREASPNMPLARTPPLPAAWHIDAFQPVGERVGQLTFGFEIECLMPDAQRASFPRGGYHDGAGQPKLPSGWLGGFDRSILAEPDTYSLEIISPILHGADGMRQVAFVLHTLAAHGASVNASCGLHVHVGAKGLSRVSIAAVKAAFRHFEPAFFALCGARMVERLTGRGWEYCKTASGWGGDWDRRQSLNTANVANRRKQTVEFRCFAATLDIPQALAAVWMSVALVGRAHALSGPWSQGLGDAPIQRPDYAADTFLAIHDAAAYRLLAREQQERLLAVLRAQARVATETIAATCLS